MLIEEISNTFPIPEIIYDPSLIFSPHVSRPRDSRLDTEPGRNDVRLPLDSRLDDLSVFRQSVTTLTGWEISWDQPLGYSTLAPWIKKLGVITGFRQVAFTYTLRYAAGKAFDQVASSSIPLRKRR